MSVIQLHAHPLIPVVYRDRTEAVLEITCEDRFTEDMLLELGFRMCGRCGDWCQPVRIEPDVGCGRCEFEALKKEIAKGLGLQESATRVAERIYRHFIVPAPEPHKVS